MVDILLKRACKNGRIYWQHLETMVVKSFEIIWAKQATHENNLCWPAKKNWNITNQFTMPKWALKLFLSFLWCGTWATKPCWPASECVMFCMFRICIFHDDLQWLAIFKQWNFLPVFTISIHCYRRGAMTQGVRKWWKNRDSQLSWRHSSFFSFFHCSLVLA